jgi:mycothiol system anti-sigma-R factor
MGAPEVGGCDELLQHVWVYLDHETDPPTCAGFEAHLRECGRCQRVVQFDLRFKQLVRRCADTGPVPRSRIEALRARLEFTLGMQAPPPSQPA